MSDNYSIGNRFSNIMTSIISDTFGRVLSMEVFYFNETLGNYYIKPYLEDTLGMSEPASLIATKLIQIIFTVLATIIIIRIVLNILYRK